METVRGYVDHIVFQNKENGYAVISFVCEGEELICVGSFQSVEAGELLELTGNYVEHPVYGRQLKVESIRVSTPDDAISMERYLGSGAIKGIGEALAARIVKNFGNETFRIMEEEPERLAEIKGISLHKAQEIGQQMIEKKRYAGSVLVFAAIWDFQYPCSENLPSVWNESVQYYERKSLPAGRGY